VSKNVGADIPVLLGAITALFTALMAAMKVRGDDWKELYNQAKQELKDEKIEHASEINENNRVIAELGKSVGDLVRGQQEMDRQIRELPKRREDLFREMRTPEGGRQ
jgi:hypothetical protein